MTSPYVQFEDIPIEQCSCKRELRWILPTLILVVLSCGIGFVITWRVLGISPHEMTIYDLVFSIWMGILLTISIGTLVTLIRAIWECFNKRNLMLVESPV